MGPWRPDQKKEKKVRGTLELQNIQPNRHPALTLINHEREHVMNISPPRGMTETELQTALHSGTHASAGKEMNFIHHELSKHIQADHPVVFPMLAVCATPKLWLSPVAVIPQG